MPPEKQKKPKFNKCETSQNYKDSNKLRVNKHVGILLVLVEVILVDRDAAAL